MVQCEHLYTNTLLCTTVRVESSITPPPHNPPRAPIHAAYISATHQILFPLIWPLTNQYKWKILSSHTYLPCGDRVIIHFPYLFCLPVDYSLFSRDTVVSCSIQPHTTFFILFSNCLSDNNGSNCASDCWGAVNIFSVLWNIIRKHLYSLLHFLPFVPSYEWILTGCDLYISAQVFSVE